MKFQNKLKYFLLSLIVFSFCVCFSQEEKSTVKKTENLKDFDYNDFLRQKIKNKQSELSSGKNAPNLSSDEPIVYDEKTGKLIAKKNAKISGSGFELEADKIEFSSEESNASAFGNVRVTQGKSRLVANSLDYSLSDKSISSSSYRFAHTPLFAEGKDVVASKEIIKAKDTTVYFNEPDFLSLNMLVEDFSYNPDTEILELEDSYLRIGNVPFMYLPYYSQKGLKRPPIDYTGGAGYSDNLGGYMSNTIYYNGLEYFSPGVLADYYYRRGVLAGPAGQIDYKDKDHNIYLDFQTGFIDDEGSAALLGTDVLGRAIGHNRNFTNLRYIQNSWDSLDVIASIDWWSDSEVLRDYRDNLFYDNQVPDNFVEASYRGDFYSFDAFMRFAPNDWEEVVQRMPEISANLNPINLFNLGEYHTAFASFVRLESSTGDITEDLSSTRFDAYYGINRPIALTKYLVLNPVAGVRLDYYTDTASSGGSYTRVMGQVGADLQMNVYGQWDVQNKTWGINGLRHNLRPVLSYRYIPKLDSGSADIIELDTSLPSIYPELLDLSQMRNVDDINEQNTLRMGVENYLDTRDSIYGSRQLAWFNIYQDLRLQRYEISDITGELENTISPTYLYAGISPAYWLNIETYSSYDFSTMSTQDIIAGIKIKDGNEWSVGFYANYSENENTPINQYYIEAKYNISEYYSVWARWIYDADLNQLDEQVYTLSTRISATWIFDYQLKHTVGSTRENDFSFSFRVRFIGL